jgi:hypothetical protein
MAAGDQQIICRRCGETISQSVDSCPHCGAEIRSRKGPLAALIVGLVIALPTVIDFGELWPYTAIGLIIAFGGAYFLYDRRRRIRDAGGSAGGSGSA